MLHRVVPTAGSPPVAENRIVRTGEKLRRDSLVDSPRIAPTAPHPSPSPGNDVPCRYFSAKGGNRTFNGNFVGGLCGKQLSDVGSRKTFPLGGPCPVGCV